MPLAAERPPPGRRTVAVDPIDRTTAGATLPDALLARLDSSTAGLSDAEVTERLSTYGNNVLTRDRTTAWRILVRQFESPLVYFLLVAAALSYTTGDVSDGSIILAILVINAALGFHQEYRSEKAVEKLASIIANKVSVRRDGSTAVVVTSALVPGDVVTLKEGDVVPADTKLLTAEDVEVDESQLTGESVQVAKAAQTDAASGGDASIAFTGSVVVSGELTGVVYATGDQTAFGRIASLSRGIHKVTQYQKSLAAFSTLLMKIVLCSLAVTVGLKLLVNRGPENVTALLVFVIALAVSVVPEALPVIATLTMARGAVEMAKQRVIVKRLSSLEDLGDVTLLCTDKTGTLTEGKLSVVRLTSSDPDRFETLVAATLDPASRGQEGTQASFDLAFEAFIPGPQKDAARRYRVVSDSPFDPAARRRRVLLEDNKAQRVLVVIGSPETLLGLSQCPIKDQYLAQIQREGQQGIRHLGVACRDVGTGEPTDCRALEHDLTFLGFVSLSDPLRPGTADTIARAKQLGVAVKILTGDSVAVAAYVAAQVDLTDQHQVVSGDDLAKASGDEVAAVAASSNVFARVSPEQKYDLIGAFKKTDVVGYEGDGINDAPSLKLADVGIAVDSATDVAKANADIILLDRSLAVIVNGIRQGRAIFANVNKYIVYTMVGNLGNFLALSLLYLLATSLPILPTQLLLLSLLTDLPLVAISTDSVDESELGRPSKSEPRQLLSLSLVLGTLTAAFELVFFLTLHHDPLTVKETSLYLFLSYTQLIVLFSVRNRDHFWRATRPSWQLAGAMALTGVVAIALTYLPETAHIFSFARLSGAQVGTLLGWAAVYFVALDALKVLYYKTLGHRPEDLQTRPPTPAITRAP